MTRLRRDRREDGDGGSDDAAPPRQRRTKRVTTRVEETPLDQLPEAGIVADDLLPPGVGEFVDELGEDVVKVILYRRKANKQVYLGTIDADQFSLDYVAHTYGGGHYFARLRGDGGFLANRSRTFLIDEAIKPDPPKPPLPEGQLTTTLLERLLDRGQQKDPMEIAAALGQVAATQAQTTMSAIMGAIMPLLQQLTQKERTTTPAADVLSAVELGLSLGGKDDSYLPVIKEFGPPIVSALQAMTQRGRPAQPGATTMPTPTTPSAIPLPPGTPEWVPLLAPHVAKVIEFAQRGATPGTVAAALDLQYPRVARWLETAAPDPTFAPALLQHFPALQPIRAWVDAFLEEFLPDAPDGAEDMGNDDAGE